MLKSNNSLIKAENYLVASQNEKTFKIVVIGDSNVGKTSLTYRFCEGQCLDLHTPTIGVDFRVKVINIGGEKVKLHLWDTAGQERFRNSMVSHFYRNADAVIIVYDVTKMSTFQNVETWLKECEMHVLTNQVPFILVGNKCDCVDSVKVNTYVAQHFADLHNMPLFETSAQSDSESNNVEAIFLTLAHKLIRQRPMMLASPGFNETLHRENVISITRSIRGADNTSNYSCMSYCW